MEIVPSPNVIGAEVHAVDLAKMLSDSDFARIEAAFNERAVLCFRDQRLAEGEFVEFGKRFGEIEPHFLTHYAHPVHPEKHPIRVRGLRSARRPAFQGWRSP